jgi:type II secretory pathway pseudopilin PulG
MFRRLGILNRNQKGFSLVELLVAVAITRFITGVVGTSIVQVIDINARSTTHMIAVRQVENAVHWLSRDGQMAQTLAPDTGSGFPLVLTWTTWDSVENQVTYTIENGELKRSLSLDGGDLIETLIAKHIDDDAAQTTCQYTGGVLAVKVTASIGGLRPATEMRLFEIIPRSAF